MPASSRLEPLVRPMLTGQWGPARRHLLQEPPQPRLLATKGTKATKSTKPPKTSTSKTPDATQVHPLGAYYDAVLDGPLPPREGRHDGPPKSAPAAASPSEPQSSPAPLPAQKSASPSSSTTAATASAPPTSTTPPGPTVLPTPPRSPAASPSVADRARIVFGSRLAGPAERAERLAELRRRSRTVAGVVVPPRPEEPDNCCMSGCVNCVWDRYREEVEEWAAAEASADAALREEKKMRARAGEQKKAAEARRAGPDAASSMDDGGGGSETAWSVPTPAVEGSKAKAGDTPTAAKDLWDDQLYRNVPVGIREFMRTEKMLKERHVREGTTGG